MRACHCGTDRAATPFVRRSGINHPEMRRSRLGNVAGAIALAALWRTRESLAQMHKRSNSTGCAEPALSLGSALEPTLVVRQVMSHARTAPSACAVVDTHDSITYRQLIARAEALTVCLREAGVSRDVLVSICLDRSVGFV